jgi:hypothetical protein
MNLEEYGQGMGQEETTRIIEMFSLINTAIILIESVSPWSGCVAAQRSDSMRHGVRRRPANGWSSHRANR